MLERPEIRNLGPQESTFLPLLIGYQFLLTPPPQHFLDHLLSSPLSNLWYNLFIAGLAPSRLLSTSLLKTGSAPSANSRNIQTAQASTPGPSWVGLPYLFNHSPNHSPIHTLSTWPTELQYPECWSLFLKSLSTILRLLSLQVLLKLNIFHEGFSESQPVTVTKYLLRLGLCLKRVLRYFCFKLK